MGLKSTIAALALLATSAMPSAAVENSIADVAASTGKFNTLLAAAKAAGLADDLDQVDGLTVFAPTDAAFAKLPAGTVTDLLKPENRGRLRAILAYHIVPARVLSTDVARKPKLVETLNGCERVRTRRAADGKVYVDGVVVTKANITATNGVIHVIGTVLLPDRDCP